MIKQITNKKHNRMSFSVLIFFILAMSICNLAYAQDNKQGKSKLDNEQLIDQYVQSKGSGIIVFDASNIKQFWISNAVVSQDNCIKILTNNDSPIGFRSIPLKIQLANVVANQDCTINIITENDDLSFSIDNTDSKIISSSEAEEQFIQYRIVSSSFHLSDTKSLSFNIIFSSTRNDYIAIKKIILSFSPNVNFLSSPGVLSITGKNTSLSGGSITNTTESSFTVKRLNQVIRIFSQKDILVSDNTLTAMATIKNLGNKPITVYNSFAPYTITGQRISHRNYPYKNNLQTYKVVSSEANSNKIIIESYPEWQEKCFVVFNAEDDLSDFSNLSFLDGSIIEIKKTDNEMAEITLDKPLQTALPRETRIRIHYPDGATYIYTDVVSLQPGEEITVNSTISKDDSFFQYSPKAFSKGVYYVKPLLQFVSDDPDSSIQISNYTVSF